MATDFRVLFEKISQRYRGIEPEALEAVLRPVLIPIDTLDKSIIKLPKQTHYRASFSIRITPTDQQLLQRGRTGKFVPRSYTEGGPWREIAKGRIISVEREAGIANGEVYKGGGRDALEKALENLSSDDF